MQSIEGYKLTDLRTGILQLTLCASTNSNSRARQWKRNSAESRARNMLWVSLIRHRTVLVQYYTVRCGEWSVLHPLHDIQILCGVEKSNKRPWQHRQRLSQQIEKITLKKTNSLCAS